MTHSAAHDDASLSLTSRTDRGGYVVAALRGGLGIASAPALREQLRSLLRRATVPARGRIDGVIAGVATQPARPAMDLATARAGQGLIKHDQAEKPAPECEPSVICGWGQERPAWFV